VRTATSTLLACLVLLPPPGGALVAAQPAPRFRSAVQMVTVAAVVRDRKGRFVRDLAREDVQVFDKGRPRDIRDFRADAESPISLALLFDESGSMSVAANAAAAKDAAKQILAALDPRRDEVAVFSFDSSLREVAPFSSDIAGVSERLGEQQPFGTTALFDAVAGVSERLAARGGRRKAIVVLTDGLDNASRLSPEQVASTASAIDVPVYVLAVVSPLDHPGAETAVESHLFDSVGALGDISRETGGDVFVSSAPAHMSVAAREIISELRHQYLIAFEASSEPGWHPIEVKIKEGRATVRARRGYAVGS
jgi:Ca-activated chloride channel family protein